MLREYRGTWDLAQGTVTDDETGEVFVYSEWQIEIDRRIDKTLQDLSAGRNKKRDDINLPGNKPYFEDDWTGKLPSQTKPTGRYPYELGFRGPYVPMPDPP
jgi:hypothetical protein